MEAIRINLMDNVAVALVSIKAGTEVNLGNTTVILLEDIPQGHKFATDPIKAGENVVKYGFSIGNTTVDVSPGQWIHLHNVATSLGESLAYEYQPIEYSNENSNMKPVSASFMGYRRKDGNAGIRNEVWIVPTVGCVNSMAERMAKNIENYASGKVDGVYTFPHPYGCSQMGDDQTNTQKVLAGLVNHPNAGAVLVLGLGCENNNIEFFKTVLGLYDTERVAFLECQSVEDEMEAAQGILKKLVDYAARFYRVSIQASQLVVGLKCGGSDGLSGITANPLVGKFSDLLIALGGSTILTEVPEMFGAETILLNRSKDKKIFDKTVLLINGFKKYFESHNQVIYENPSPGNKSGGISTLEDKSLGCTQKGGTAKIVDVLSYGEVIHQKGLNLLEAPGNDLVASTALAVAGAQLILFTTGRGTPFGAPVPTVKISSNTALYENKRNWIDFDGGRIATGTNMEVLAEELFQYVIQVASGEETQAEKNGYRDIAIFKTGVTL